MTTAKKSTAKTAAKPAARKIYKASNVEATAPAKRGGRRNNSGRQTVDGSSGIITTSFGLEQSDVDWVNNKPGGKSVWLRGVIKHLRNLESKRAEARKS